MQKRLIWTAMLVVMIAAQGSAEAQKRAPASTGIEGTVEAAPATVDRARERRRDPPRRRIDGVGPAFGGGAEVSRDGRRITGTGARFGSGFESSRDRRRVVGTGGNFGGGYDVSSGGRRITGTGTRFGGGYEVGSRRITGTGSNFGRGW
jgi:hypothetical protein